MNIQRLVLLLFPLLYQGHLLAQRNSIIVKAGKTIKESLPVTDLYEYPQFTHGTVFFKNGKSSGGTMNYNRFLDEMQFITAAADTVTIDNEKDIAFINIDNDTFFYDRGYIKLVNGTASAKLGVKQILRIVDKEKAGAYGTTSSTESIDSYNSFNDGKKDYNLTVMQDIVLGRKVQYYLGDNNNHFVLATKKNLLKLFPQQEQSVNNYLKENPVVFDNKEDLEKLIKFLR